MCIVDPQSPIASEAKRKGLALKAHKLRLWNHRISKKVKMLIRPKQLNKIQIRILNIKSYQALSKTKIWSICKFLRPIIVKIESKCEKMSYFTNSCSKLSNTTSNQSFSTYNQTSSISLREQISLANKKKPTRFQQMTANPWSNGFSL